MKKYLVIGNPIEHSLSPKLHNYWIKKNNLDAAYDKKRLNESDIKGIIDEVKNGKIDGINVTVPFKKSVIPFLDKLTPLANETRSVNTIYKEKENAIDVVVGDNTDVGGFKQSLEYINYKVKNKKIFILGAGGVVPSILKALEKLEAAKVYISNRTKKKAKDLESYYKISLGLETLDWGQSPDFDIIINATSLGLKNNDKIELDYNKHKPKFFGKKKLFYDVIYNPGKTNFLLKGEELGNETTNGKMMFVCQAQLAFKIWHDILPKIDNETIKLLEGQTPSLTSISPKF
jgi:shikimate dehydrogenase